MKAAELEQAVSSFFENVKDAAYNFSVAQTQEQELEDMTQDLLHTAELQPELLDSVDLVELLHSIREKRREAKMELEVARIFFNYVQSNQAVLNKLQNELGQMRKVLKRQALDTYRYKTDVLHTKDSFLARKPEPTYHQYTIWELIK